MKIVLPIDRLVLDGSAVEPTRVLRRELERELTQRLTSGGLSPELRGGGLHPHIRGGDIALGRDAHPAKLGSQIAGAVYRGIGRAR